MISSVITHRARPRGDGAPSGAVLMALGASLPFSIIMWTTGATAQSETSQVSDEEGARMFLSDSFFLFITDSVLILRSNEKIDSLI